MIIRLGNSTKNIDDIKEHRGVAPTNRNVGWMAPVAARTVFEIKLLILLTRSTTAFKHMALPRHLVVMLVLAPFP